ncbi:MAG: NAD(+) diphosphatase [Pseudomonadota bacterium]
MTFALFDAPHPDHSTRVGFSRNALQRLSEKRDAQSVAAALGDPRATTLVIGRGTLLLKDNSDDRPTVWRSFGEAKMMGARIDHPVLLGYEDDGTPRFACFAMLDGDDAPSGHQVLDYRSIYMQGLLGEADLGALAQGAALVAWHQSHRHCSRCGAQSVMSDGGYKRTCPECDAQHFPRTDPVVIMLTVSADGERVLLGRSPHFPEGMYSCLAGFVEPGETLENAVRRETLEEAGIQVGRVAYHASQPWPFPYSMMIGMYGEAVSETIKLDEELDDARWFDRAEVQQMIAGEHRDGIRMPPKGAIAWRLVEDWVDRP